MVYKFVNIIRIKRVQRIIAVDGLGNEALAICSDEMSGANNRVEMNDRKDG